MSEPKVKRVLIKLSGESLSTDGNGIQVEAISDIIKDIKQVLALGVQIAIVIGGGNILRGGRTDFKQSIKRATADQMGMLATMINALALTDILNANGLKAQALSSRGIDGVLQTSNAKDASKFLCAGEIVVFAGGTGNPFVTTDTTASLRAAEIEADAILKATTVDGVYDKDPNKYKDAKKYHELTFDEALKKELAVMDLSAFLQCREFNIPICVFNMENKGAVLRVVQGESEGTWVTQN